MILGLTGGMGCGKTTTAQMLERRGFRRIDSDALVRAEILTEPEVATAIGARFGPGVLAADGQIIRGHLAEIVFSDEAALRWLEEITHPRLFARWRALLGAAPEADWVVEVPLLFEKQLENWFDFTLCVASDSSLQIARLEQRGLSRALAEQRIFKQLPLARKIELADFVLLNDGSPDFLQQQADRLVSVLAA
ncbi:MAG TPA: dephospho-CoA kinase [Opitutaceae bacterium]|jgi:dephospho-CoA kinase|nr:dephospho-CoA kinase [Opitutaceae bacterium]